MSNKNVFFVGVDVGSGSARAALVNAEGHVVKCSKKELEIWRPSPGCYEQSSSNIWDCCIQVIKDVVSGVEPGDVKGIGFDATCSLVALDTDGNASSVSNSNNNNQNVIMWMDHRAQAEADFINESNHDLLKYVGGKVSLEMEMPKLLWLKKHLTHKWLQYGLFFDLPDFLTWKATGSLTRSLCSLVCKWNYEYSNEGNLGWNVSFLKQIGLEDLCENDFFKIGNKVLIPGEPCNNGLTGEVAEVLGLKIGTPVATSIIDAHAGGLGMIGTHVEGIDSEMPSRLSLICGTSTCHMAVNQDAIPVQGIWGPYFSAMVPNLWLNEAGQSASGMLLDHVISSHPAGMKLLKSSSTGELRYQLHELLKTMAKNQGVLNVSELSKDFHVWPDFHGNRSPLADPTLKGMIVGLTIDNSEENLALLYLATIQALAYGTRLIIDSLVTSGYKQFKSLLICGGLSKDPLFVQVQADSVGLPVLRPDEEESVLIGAAILGACASRFFGDVEDAIKIMGGKASIIYPDTHIYSYHNKKYSIFLRMLKDQLKYRAMMS